MVNHRLYLLPLIAGMSALFIMDGCMPLSAVQSPVALEPGGVSAGLGLPLTWREGEAGREVGTYGVKIPSLSPYLYVRQGLAEHLDVGFKFYGIPYLAGGLSGDLKYQFLNDPLVAAVDLDLSLSTLESIAGCGECWFAARKTFFGFAPGVLAGTEHFYGGVRFLTWYSSEQGTAVFPALLGGISLGSAFRLIFDMSSMEPFSGHAYNVLNLGLQVAWR